MNDEPFKMEPSRRRPGPFGPARALLPKEQQPLMLEGSTLVSDAIERLVDNGYSQIPVTDKDDKIIGVFSWKTFGKRVADLRATKIKPLDLPIREAMEPAKFVDPEVFIDTETDWSDIDYVLVGSADNLIGILCIADVFGRLNDFAEAFVLIYEIEHELRDVIRDVYPQDELNELLESLSASQNRKTNETVDGLKRVMNEQGPISEVGKAIKLLQASTSRHLDSLEDFTFAQYRALICAEKNWSRFEQVFATMRELLDADLGEVNQIRNVVFHFRRAITPKDTDRLRRFREKVRYDRKLYTESR